MNTKILLSIMSSFAISRPAINSSETYTNKSTYSFHSANVTVDFDDTQLINNIYGSINNLFKNGYKNINLDYVKLHFWSDITNFNNFEVVSGDINKYISEGKQNPDYYKDFHLYGTESYEWNYGSWCPEYHWRWDYVKPNEDVDIPIHTERALGYGKADRTITFVYKLSW